MPHFTALLGFALISFGMVLTPGPNMIYLISRSITQGPAAGIVSLGGVALGFVFYMLCAAFGITAFLFAVPCRRALIAARSLNERTEALLALISG